MRQLVGTGTLSRLAHKLQPPEHELEVIPLWPCTGVLVVAPDEAVEPEDDGGSDDDDQWDGNAVGLEIMVSGMEQPRFLSRSTRMYVCAVPAT